MHVPALLLTLAAGLAAALVLGLITERLRLSPIVGYLLAGVVIGPHTPGFVGDPVIAGHLAEIGVVLLMFGVGLHFHLADLLAVKRVAIPGALGQSAVATLLGTTLALACGWSWTSGLMLGAGLSVASTVVLMRVLVDHGQLATVHGHIAVGWLIVEDLLTVLVLVLVPVIGGFVAGDATAASSGILTVGLAFLKVAVFGAGMLVFGTRVIPRLLDIVARTRSRELFTLSVLVLALAIAVGAAVFFGVSMALGAFLAGMVVGQSKVSHQAAADAVPMRDAFAVLFFVSVGMLFDPHLIFVEPLLLFGALAVVLVGKPLAAFVIVIALRHPVRSALTVAIGLAQVGEFSFILAELARVHDLLPAEGQSALIAAALVSITLNPLLFRGITGAERWLEARPRLWALVTRRRGADAEQAYAAQGRRLAEVEDRACAVIVGYGPVGQTVARILREVGILPVIVDLNVDTIAQLNAAGETAIYGDAGRADILRAAGIERARFLLVTLPGLARRLPVIIAARDLNPEVKIFVRAHYLGERAMLEEVGATAICYEEAEAAVALSGFLLEELGLDQAARDLHSQRIRAALAADVPQS